MPDPQGFTRFAVDRLGAKMIMGIVGTICLTVTVVLKVFPTQPTFFEFSAMIGGLLGLTGAVRIWEKTQEYKKSKSQSDTESTLQGGT